MSDIDHADAGLLKRFWSKVAKSESCWEWTGCKVEGYGTIKIGGVERRSHRVSYEWNVGPIPEGLQLDHLCRNRSCVNPEHLEPVTMKENILRGESFSAINARKTHCPRGHELVEGNLVISMLKYGKRKCLTCRRKYDNDWAKAKRRENKSD